jgi:hypothetical protein
MTSDRSEAKIKMTTTEIRSALKTIHKDALKTLP